MPGLLDTIGDGVEGLTGLLQKPIVRGALGAAAVGANPLVGLLAGPVLKSREEQLQLEIDERRAALNNNKRRTDAQDALTGLLGQTTDAGASILSTPEGQREALGLLTNINPSAATQGLLGQIFPQQTGDRAPPSAVRTLLAAGIDPQSEEGRKILVDSLSKGDSDIETQRALLDLQRENLEFRQALNEVNEGKASKAKAVKFAEKDLNSSVDALVSFIDANDKLKGSAVSPGGGFIGDLAEGGTRALAAAGNIFGIETPGSDESIRNVDDFKKFNTISLLNTFEKFQQLGTITDQKLQTVRDASGGFGTNPDTNSLIAANMLDELLTIADIEGVSLDRDVKELQSIIGNAVNRGDDELTPEEQAELEALEAELGNDG